MFKFVSTSGTSTIISFLITEGLFVLYLFTSASILGVLISILPLTLGTLISTFSLEISGPSKLRLLVLRFIFGSSTLILGAFISILGSFILLLTSTFAGLISTLGALTSTLGGLTSTFAFTCGTSTFGGFTSTLGGLTSTLGALTSTFAGFTSTFGALICGGLIST